MEFAPRRILEALDSEAVEFIVVGGVALVLHGSARITADLDVCYERSPDNLERVTRALAPLNPRLRGAPAGLPFRVDPPTLAAGLNFTFTTDGGDFDLLGELSGVGGYSDLRPGTVRMEAYGLSFLVISLADLERAKRAAGRRKDLLDLDEIAEIRKLTGA
jgi:hypothetical protein